VSAHTEWALFGVSHTQSGPILLTPLGPSLPLDHTSLLEGMHERPCAPSFGLPACKRGGVLTNDREVSSHGNRRISAYVRVVVLGVLRRTCRVGGKSSVLSWVPWPIRPVAGTVRPWSEMHTCLGQLHAVRWGYVPVQHGFLARSTCPQRCSGISHGGCTGVRVRVRVRAR